MTRICVISDTHILKFAELPRQLLEAFKTVDIIMHAGDIVGLEVLEELNKQAPQVHAVCGNMDPPQIRQILPKQKLIQTGALKLGLIHGSGSPASIIDTVTENFQSEAPDCIVYGHSHIAYNKIHQGILYFNPGSPTDKFFAPFNSYGMLEIGSAITGKIIKL